MSTIDELRGLVERANRKMGPTVWPILVEGEKEFREVVVAAMKSLPALLAVAEAARKAIPYLPCIPGNPDGNYPLDELESALARLDGEVGHG